MKTIIRSKSFVRDEYKDELRANYDLIAESAQPNSTLNKHSKDKHKVVINSLFTPNTKTLAHIGWMCKHMPNDDVFKYQRWLGFMQGVLWAYGLRSIKQLRRDVKNKQALYSIKRIINMYKKTK